MTIRQSPSRPYDLHGGLGNKINNLLNGLLSGARSFNWIVDKYNGARWQDLFAEESLDLKVVNTLSRSPVASYDWFFRHTEHQTEAAEYISALKPSLLVEPHIKKIPAGTIGHSVRLRHGKIAHPYPPFKIDGTGFLSADCREMRQINSHMIQSKSIGGVTDLDPDLRGLEGTTYSTADWFTLMRCDVVVNHGRIFRGFEAPHSTFLDAHRIFGKLVIEGCSQ